jgi:hypothetical protein
VNDIINRKQFLERFALVGLAMAGGASLLSSCGGGGDKSESTGGSQTSTTTTETAEASDPCSDYTGLTETDLAMRKNLKYVAKSTDEGKNCENCKFYLVDESSTECGKCQLFKGPVSPEGHCASWFAKDQG